MLRIIVDGIDLDIPEDFELTIKRENPFFSDKSFNEGYTYSFLLPVTPIIYKLFYNKNTTKTEFGIKITFKSDLWISGVVIPNATRHDNVSMNIVEGGTDLRKKANDTPLSKLKLFSQEICDEADPALTKIQKWQDHMRENTLNEPVSEGTHKFPKLFTDGYRENVSFEEVLNIIHWSNNDPVNAYVLNDYVPNASVPTSFNPSSEGKDAWYTTVSPCIRIQYLLIEVLKYLGVENINNRLDDIAEYLQMYHFSGYVYDRKEIEGSFYYNTHGLNLDLNDHLPNANMSLIFELLTEVFEAYYVQSGNSLNIMIRTDIINQKPIDMSRYVSNEYSREKNTTRNFKVFYPIDDDQRYRYRDFAYSSYTQPWTVVPTYDTIETSASTQPKLTDVELKNIPLWSFYFDQYGYFSNFADYVAGEEWDKIGFGEWNAAMFYAGNIRSDHYPDEGIEQPTTFNWGLLRGQHTTRLDIYDYDPGTGEPIGVIDEQQVDHMYNYGHNQLQLADDTIADFQPYLTTFGQTSAYIGDQDDIYNRYKKPYLDFLSNTGEVVKNLNLASHKVKELTTWKNPKHVIKQKNMSFQGIVKDVTIVLRKRSISQTTITYMVMNNDELNEFSDDFSDDFSN